MNTLKKQRTQLETSASELLKAALKSGMQQAEVVAVYSQASKISMEKQDFQLASTDEGYSIGLRVIHDGHQGFTSHNSLSAADLKWMAAKATEIARISEPNPYASIPKPQRIPDTAPTLGWDEALFQLSMPTQKEWALKLYQTVTSDKRFLLNEGALQFGADCVLVMNSLGIHQVHAGTSASWSLMGMARDGNILTSFDYFSRIARQARRLGDKIVADAIAFRDEIISDLVQGPSQSYRGVVAFSPRAVSEIFLSGLSSHLNGRSVLENQGHWKLQDIEKTVLNQKIRLEDQPWYADRFGYALFDREGTPTRPLSLIDQGVLRNFALDSYAAAGLKRPTTGHAAGSSTTLPSVGFHSLSLAGGETPWKTIIRDLSAAKENLLVVNRFSGQVDSTTGDFSGVAKGGHWWQHGERVYTVNETLISGNIFDTLGSGLVELSQETLLVNSSEDCPYLVADGISVTGR